jgi:hypothetical protein
MDPDDPRHPSDQTPLGAPPSNGPKTPDVALRPRWLWIIFAVVAIAIPLLGLLLERNP